MKYLSLFSGIEAATVAWKELGWDCVGFSEIEPFPCSVLNHYYPHIPNLGDITEITEQQIKDLGEFDLLVFGSPCQNLAFCGNRKGFAGGSSSLFYEAIRIFNYARKHNNCRFALWENVFGAFSSNKGQDFAVVVREMAGLNHVDTPKYGWGNTGVALGENGLLEWRVLDAQYFGLPQRRKRVFALLDTGAWEHRPPILIERESLSRNTKKSSEAEQDATTTSKNLTQASSQCYSKDVKLPIVAIAFDARQSMVISEELAYTLLASDYKGPQSVFTLDKGIIRRMTPIEYERLMGFPDNYTNIIHNGTAASKTARYKALGNSMAVPVMRWIGERIQAVI